jgi:transcriptional regulator with XRE-family HTH domain
MNYNAYEIGQRVSNARNNKNLSQLELSEELGIAQSSLSRFETGLGPISLEKAIQLCNLLDKPLSWLVGDNNGQFTPDELRDIELFKQFLLNKRSVKK